MIERHTREGALDQLHHKAGRAHLGKLWYPCDQVGLSNRRLNLKNPASRPKAAFVFHFAAIEEALDGLKRNLDRFRRHHDLEMAPYMLIEGREACAQLPVIVDRQRTRMDLKSEGAQRACQA